MDSRYTLFYLLVILLFNKRFATSTIKLTNSPACHLGIMRLFHWCEQSECSNCTCLSKNNVCKQICNKRTCDTLFCSSPQTCYQSVLVDRGKPRPVASKLVAHTPITQQDCSHATCQLMKAVRYTNTVSRSFQSCSEGKCGDVYSNADVAKQFCGNCNRMTCAGTHAKNCTQICVFGNCKQMTCNAKHCTQLCSHDSTCELTCGSNSETCEQICNHGSTCTMKCYGKSCQQKCDNAHNCTVVPIVTTTTSTTTTSTTTTTTTIKPTIPTTISTPRTVKKTMTTDINNEVVIDGGHSELPKNVDLDNENKIEAFTGNQRSSSSRIEILPLVHLTLVIASVMLVNPFL